MMKATSLRLPDELLARIDRAAGDVPRERWIRRAIEEKLGGGPILPAEESGRMPRGVGKAAYTSRRVEESLGPKPPVSPPTQSPEAAPTKRRLVQQEDPGPGWVKVPMHLRQDPKLKEWRRDD